jgi:hypothetical protein
VYLKNDSVNKVTFSEIRLAGEIYNYVDKGASPLATYTTDLKTTDVAEYTIVEEGFVDNSNMAITLDSSSPSLEPGQQATMMLQLESDVKSGRDLQFKLTTSSGAVFVGTIQSGQQSG